jgi:hypothetical protein
MTAYVIQDREMIIQAVFDGQLGVEYISMDEIYEIEDELFEEIANQQTPFTTWETIQ